MTPKKEDQALGLVAGYDAGVQLIKFDADAALTVIELVAQGDTLTQALKRPGTPSRSTFYKWLSMYPELHTAYEAARELSAQALEEEALDMARELKNPNDYTGVKTRQYEIIMGQLRWSAARRDPKRYGARQEVNAVIPIQINTTLDLNSGAPTLPGQSPDAVYTLEAHLSGPDPSSDLADEAFTLPDVPTETSIPRRPKGRPLGYSPPHPKHKTAHGKAVTVGMAKAKAKRKAEKDGTNTSGGS